MEVQQFDEKSIFRVICAQTVNPVLHSYSEGEVGRSNLQFVLKYSMNKICILLRPRRTPPVGSSKISILGRNVLIPSYHIISELPNARPSVTKRASFGDQTRVLR